MAKLLAFIRRHSVPVYYALTFTISWGGVLFAVGPANIPSTEEHFRSVLPLAIGMLLAGPSFSGLLMTGLVHGRAGYRELWARLCRWNVGAGWYAVAFLGAPLVLFATLLALSAFSPVFLPGVLVTDEKVTKVAFGLAVAVSAGFFEELGWMGFAVPELRRRHGVLATALIAGVLWGAWHIFTMAAFAGVAYAGELSLPVFMTLRSLGLLVGGLPAFRLIMVWAHERNASLLLAMLLHFGLTAATLIFEPVGLVGSALITYDVVSTAVWWLVIAAVVAASRGRLARSPLQRRARFRPP